MRKDKEKVLDEQWDDARVASFLTPRPGDGEGTEADYQLLLRAYQSMRDSDFARFVPMFCAARRDLNVVGPEGQTLLKLLAEHRYGAAYADILRANGAL
ncbi:MAG: PA4642 family protein [Congregibacter sp.]